MEIEMKNTFKNNKILLLKFNLSAAKLSNQFTGIYLTNVRQNNKDP